MKNYIGNLQKLGKALMAPVAVLPAAALLMRLGAPDVLNIPIVMAAGDAIFGNLPLIFALGVSMGLAGGAGAAALAGGVGYHVLIKVLDTMNPDINMGVLAGIITGVAAASLYNKYKDIRLPDFLGFFGGKRFIPIVTSFTMLILGIIFGFIWPPIQAAIYAAGEWTIQAGALGVGVFGFLNRLLIPTGLHHVINNVVWFIFGEFTNAAGEVVTGDLYRFFAGDPSAGIFMTGFFPVMMFGLPAACFAMLHEAKDSERKAVSGVLISAALTSFLTGITEPIEFAFMFLAPVLYVIHALLTGISMALTYMLGLRHGFGFSAGFIDYALNFKLATQPILLLIIGVAYGALYYVIFRYFIRKYDLPTPGRIEGETSETPKGKVKISEKAERILAGLGGPDNIENMDACITRIRLTVRDISEVDESAIKRAGATGVMKLGGGNLQVVVGTEAELIVEEIKKVL
ncbi:PTS system, N-acetylglucosamine-specific IIBC subunit [Tepidanaerobacter acetatoxydans Re1]|uniref:PTS system, N-acetylglucosamine-specific IIBC subunit n=1 Tax=Tepidanaerobacter acetatoxydans (strain DSM 21804 / JCM 16047 / Re1) TaxID=1209989 RepID=F4LX73_TEPAE|nr:N-acetylglucosamine-specific PTS transporter subunit IIBC [Tepidanaerobacter acetatoxydans]AEE91872.1 PTS system, N-acetylglucosamine-specific IIBC subunit [Tepidanaerobacter acetatoxydans Re1]CCP26682.1 PTS system, N-acetylglucosamine-specific IIBC subunit [Tepidanaerobacter acetatoxydans Re1]